MGYLMSKFDLLVNICNADNIYFKYTIYVIK